MLGRFGGRVFFTVPLVYRLPAILIELSHIEAPPCGKRKHQPEAEHSVSLRAGHIWIIIIIFTDLSRGGKDFSFKSKKILQACDRRFITVCKIADSEHLTVSGNLIISD